MPHKFLSKAAFQNKISAKFADREALASATESMPLPESLAKWLGRLKLLYGVPFQYLVPDEAMLPPESVRFFYLDMNWVDALIDGAFSIGRNLTNNTVAASMNLDAVAMAPAKPKVNRHLCSIRAKYLGTEPSTESLQVVSGFLLRSSIVTDYKGIGANVYPLGHTPKDADIQLLTILRFEPLGDQSDTLLCLVDGDAYRIDIHEAPEHLHYGIDKYEDKAGNISSEKIIHTFTQNGGDVKLSGETKPVTLDKTFRTSSPRVLKMASLGSQIAGVNPKGTVIDAASMGFEMTEGVGMVSFLKKDSS